MGRACWTCGEVCSQVAAQAAGLEALSRAVRWLWQAHHVVMGCKRQDVASPACCGAGGRVAGVCGGRGWQQASSTSTAAQP